MANSPPSYEMASTMGSTIWARLITILRYANPSLIIIHLLVTSASSLFSSKRRLPKTATITKLFWLVYVCSALDGVISVVVVAFWRWSPLEVSTNLSTCILALVVTRPSKKTVAWYQFHIYWTIGLLCNFSAAFILFNDGLDARASRDGSQMILLLHAFLAYVRCAALGVIPLAIALTQPGNPATSRAANTSARPGSTAATRQHSAIRIQELAVLAQYIPLRLHDIPFIMILCICSLGMNVLNLLVPRQQSMLMNPVETKEEFMFLLRRGTLFDFMKSGIHLLYEMLWQRMRQVWETALKETLLTHCLGLDASFHDSAEAGTIQSDSLSRLVLLMDLSGGRIIPALIGFLLDIWYFSWKDGFCLGVVVFATIVLFLGWTLFTGQLTRVKRRELSVCFVEETVYMIRSLANWYTVFSFNQIPREIHTYSQKLKGLAKASYASFKATMLSDGVGDVILQAGYLASVSVLHYQVQDVTAFQNSYIRLTLCWNQLAASVRTFARLLSSVHDQLVSLGDIAQVMSRKSKTADNPGAKALKYNRGDVKFENVGFEYGAQTHLLANMNLSFSGRKNTLLVGPSGAGKTTIFKLLMRVYNPDQGRIFIDGQDIRHVTHKSLLDHIAIVPQNPSLLKDTILENVRYARPSASEKEVHEACRAAEIHNEIIALPEQYQTQVGHLSGGQTQRISIARAILKNSPIVLLDEPTSSVDAKTSYRIHKSLTSLFKNRTVIMVTHKLSPFIIQQADVICSLSREGKFEMGSHEKLMSQGGTYASLYSYWNGTSDPAGTRGKKSRGKKHRG